MSAKIHCRFKVLGLVSSYKYHHPLYIGGWCDTDTNERYRYDTDMIPTNKRFEVCSDTCLIPI